MTQSNDLSWTRGSTDPLVMTLGSGITDVRIRVFNEDGNALAFTALLSDATVEITDAPTGKVTFTPTSTQTNKLSPNDKGSPRNTYTVEVKKGGAWLDILEGYIYADGGPIAVVPPGEGGGVPDVVPADLSIFKPGKPTADEVLVHIEVARGFTWPVSLASSKFKALVAATATYVVTIKRNGSSIGTLSWAAAGTVPTVTFAAAVDFAAGDTLELVGQTTPDATIANLSFTFYGSR
jgi:hypothetical protein